MYFHITKSIHSTEPKNKMAMPAPMAIPTVTLFVIKFVLVTEGAVSIGGSSQEELLVHMALTCNVIPCIIKYSTLFQQEHPATVYC